MRQIQKIKKREVYRYMFQGMETDPELKGNGNSYTTEFRQYDPRLGRWLSLDPLMAEFVEESPYLAFSSNPVYFNDPYGLSSEHDNKGEPDKIVMQGDENKTIKEQLPSKAKNGQIIEINHQTQDKDGLTRITTAVYDANNKVWNVTDNYFDEGTMIVGLGREMSGSAPPIENGNLPTTEGLKEHIETTSKVVTASSMIIGGIEVSAKETKKELVRNQSKLAQAAKKFKVNISVASKKAASKAIKTFAKIGKVASIAGKLLGATSAVLNFTEAALKWEKDKRGALIAGAKGLIDAGMFFLKANPVGLAASLLWTVGSSWWK